jgi:parvulin-like peptidyl-prolyl isomerase
MRVRLLALALAAAVLAGSAWAALPVGGPVVATVGGTSITLAEFNARFDIYLRRLMAQQGMPYDPAFAEFFTGLKPEILDRVVQERLLLLEADAWGIPDGRARADEEVELARTSFASEEDFHEALDEAGFMSAETFRDLIAEQFRLQALIELLVDRTPIRDSVIRLFYEERVHLFQQDAEVLTRHILVDTIEEAEAALARIRGGESFGEVAADVSTDPGSAGAGGQLPWFVRGQVVPEFEAAAFTLPLNQVSNPVRTQFGYHLVEVLDREDGRTMSLDEVRFEIEDELRRRAIERYIELLPGRYRVTTFPGFL